MSPGMVTPAATRGMQHSEDKPSPGFQGCLGQSQGERKSHLSFRSRNEDVGYMPKAGQIGLSYASGFPAVSNQGKM